MNRLIRTGFLAAAASLGASGAFAQTALIGNDPGPNRGVRAVAVNHVSDLLSDATNGNLSVEMNWGSALFPPPSALDSLSTGVADIGVVIGPYTQSVLPELNIGSMPFPPAHPWVVMKAMDELYTTNEQVQQRFEDNNIVYINNFALPENLLGCNADIVTVPSDIAGVKVSRTGSSSDIWGELGGNMVNMTVYDAYQAMDSGLIDCTDTFSYFAVATNIHELLATVAPVGLSAQSVIINMMNRDTFDSLSAEDQEAIRAAGAAMSDYYGEQLDIADKEAMAKMTDAGVVLKEFSPEGLATLWDAAQPTVQDWLADADATGLDGQALLDEMTALLAKWNEIAETEGLPWTRG